jgi:hypothetical protein
MGYYVGLVVCHIITPMYSVTERPPPSLGKRILRNRMSLDSHLDQPVRFVRSSSDYPSWITRCCCRYFMLWPLRNFRHVNVESRFGGSAEWEYWGH